MENKHENQSAHGNTNHHNTFRDSIYFIITVTKENNKQQQTTKRKGDETRQQQQKRKQLKRKLPTQYKSKIQSQKSRGRRDYLRTVHEIIVHKNT